MNDIREPNGSLHGTGGAMRVHGKKGKEQVAGHPVSGRRPVVSVALGLAPTAPARDRVSPCLILGTQLSNKSWLDLNSLLINRVSGSCDSPRELLEGTPERAMCVLSELGMGLDKSAERGLLNDTQTNAAVSSDNTIPGCMHTASDSRLLHNDDGLDSHRELPRFLLGVQSQ